MNSRFLLILLSVLFVLSCNHFVNLGDKSEDYAPDNTEGLPDEISEDRGDTGDTSSNYDDWNEEGENAPYDEGSSDSADSDWETNDSEASDWSDTGDAADSGNTDFSDTDCSDTGSEWPESGDTSTDADAEGYVFPESDPFPEGFLNSECGCGEAPQYQPVCCEGGISVFNACFANCYAVRSGNKICSLYEIGLCSGYEENDDDAEIADDSDEELNDPDEDTEIIDDNDEEIPDSDADTDADADTDVDTDTDVIANECGCYPGEEPLLFVCGEDSYFVTSCLADCKCDDPQKLF